MSQSEQISADPVARYAEKVPLLPDATQLAVQNGVRSAFASIPAGDLLKDFLHGKWLHEPLHSVLTDVPVGAWTTAVAFDVADMISGSEKMQTAADAAVDLGLVGAAGAAIAGVTDWSEIKEPSVRRIGTAHAVLNIGATALFLSSSLLRHSGRNRGLARLLAGIGYIGVGLSAHLGGNLVYEHGVGLQNRKASIPTTGVSTGGAS
jgi:uncharacterized membrane protein